ncbi:MAG: transglycosylase domain-containing protein, partial [Thermacetogeniaceae bacterium]
MPDRERELYQTRRKKKRKLRVARAILFILVLVAICLGMVGCGYVAGAIATLPAWDPDKLTGSESTVILDKDNKPATTVYAEENRTPVSLTELPPYVPDAFVAVEDARFYQHHGVDIEAIGRAVLANIRGGIGSEGGSTITQQLVKNAFLNPEKTLKRKIQEAILALEVERHYSKDQILEFYLNRIYFGNGAYGIQTASQLYFGKDAKNLTLAESALLAGIVRSPNNYNPFANKELAIKRQHL